MRILCLHIAKNQASYRYRVEQFFPYWQNHNIEVYPVMIVGKNYLKKIRLALQSREYDFVWLQRKPLSSLLVKLIISRSKLIYDFDDALYARQAGRKQVLLKDKHPGSSQTVKRINHILKNATCVFAGSETLVRYASRYNKAAYLVPTSLSLPVSVPEVTVKKEAGITIGWIGGVGNLFYLTTIDKVLALLQQNYPNLRCSVMSGRPPENLKTGWEFFPWSKEEELTWLQSIDIGIMPLENDEWSRGKCAFKLLQYMAYKKPVVASAVGANIVTVRHGVSGFLASAEEEWLSALETLIRSRSQRDRMGKAGYDIFVRKFERSIIQQTIADILMQH